MDNSQIENSIEQVSSVNSSLELTKPEQILQRYEDIFQQQQEQINFLTLELEKVKKSASQPQSKSRKKAIVSFQPVWQILIQYIAGTRGSATYQPRFSVIQILVSYLGSFFGIAALAYLSIASGYPVIAAPFGAAAVLVFAVPNSPLAQPRNLIFGNLIGGVISVLMVTLFGSGAWVMALSVATAIKVMQLTKSLHPPGGAVALVGVLSNATWDFILTPVLAGSIILLFCTFAFNNIMPERSYPKHWL